MHHLYETMVKECVEDFISYFIAVDGPLVPLLPTNAQT
jgi:hypothetical protein